jgi:hypothetical protein
MVHVSWGGTITFRDETRTPPENIVFRLTTAFLCYWNEMDPDTVQLVGGTPDLNNDGVLDVLSETFSILSNERVPNGLLSATRTGTSCFVTMPSMSMDPSGNIFIVYTAVVEGLSSRHFLNSQYRDIMIIFSEDDGDSWSDPQNLTQTRQNEEIFACVAKSANDYLHVIWQSDGTPGTNLQNHDPDIDTHAPVLNDIVYAAIPISDILNESIGQIPAGFEPITRDQAAKVFVVSQNFPNPFENNTEVIIYLRAGSDISITVTDMMGNVINQGSLGFMNAGNHTLNIDADGLSAGMYFYTISSGNNSVTKKMQVR